MAVNSLVPGRAVRLLVVAVLWAGLSSCGEEPADKLVSSAKTYLAQGDAKAAVIQLKAALQRDPELAEARLLLGKALLGNEEAVAATVELNKASDLKYRADEVVPLMAKALLMQGEYRKVTDGYGALVLASPEANADLKTSLATAYAAQGKPEKARSELAAALQSVAGFAPALVLQARMLAGERDIDGAIKLLDEVLATAPVQQDALQLRGDLLFYGKGDQAGAIEMYRKALAAKPNSIAAHGGLLTIYLSRNDLASAKEQLEALKKVRPQHAQTVYFQARIAFMNGDYKAAEEFAQQLLKVASNNPYALELAGNVAFKQKSFLKAEQFLSKVAQGAPGKVSPRRVLALTYMHLGQPQQALAVLLPLLESGSADAGIVSLAAQAYVQSGDLRKAEELFARAVKLDPKPIGTRTALALVRLSRGDTASQLGELESISESEEGVTADLALIAAYAKRGDSEGALKAIESLQKKQPGKPLADYLRAQVLASREDFAGARRSLEKALSIDPLFFAAAQALAVLDLRDGKPELAEDRFNTILKARPNNVQALLALAQLSARAGKGKEEVAGLITKAVSANPTDTVARLALVEYHLGQKDYKLALNAAQSAVGALPDRPEMLEALARVQLAAGDTNQAISSLNKLATQLPQSPVPLLRLTDVYLASKDSAAALQSAERALAIAPDSAEAIRKVVALESQAGRPAEALAVARAVQTRQPGAAIGFEAEGDIELVRRNWNSAATAYQAAMQKQPSTPIAGKLYTALRQGGKREQAQTMASAWLKTHPADEQFIVHQGEVALAQQDYSDAELRLREVIKINPDNAIALNNLAWATLSLKKPGALQYAEKANKLKPDVPAFMDTLALVLLAENQTMRALEMQKKAVALQPDDPSLQLTLAKIYVRTGDKDAARLELSRLVALGAKFPQQKEVQALLAAL